MKEWEASSVRLGSEDTESEDLNPQLFRQASEIATALARAHKSRQLYNENNPVLRTSLERLFTGLTSYLKANDTLTFSVTETEFLFHGKAIYSNPDRRESLAFRLFRDGVRAVTFHSGITQDEIVGILEILGKVNVENDESDNDIVTQIWECDLAHITYLAVDECIDENTAEEGTSGGTKPAYGSSSAGSSSAGPSSALEERADGGMGFSVMMDLPLSSEERESIADLTLTEDELEEIGQQILAEERENQRKKVFQIFVEILQGSASTEVKADVARGIQALFMDFLDGGSPVEAAGLLIEIKGLIERNRSVDSGTPLPASLEETLGNFLETLGQERQILRIEPRIEEAAPQLLDEYEQYLCQLLPNSVGPLCGMLGRMKSRRGREMLCRALSVLAQQNLGALVDLLSDPRWYLVRNLVHVLRIMKDKRAFPYLEGLLLHQDVRVRIEVVHCIAELGNEESEILMRRCLRDPERVVRTVAAKKLGHTGGNRAAASLVECILEKSFLKRPFDEKWVLFEALGHAGSDETVPILEKLLAKGSIFHSAETGEMKRCAAATLARIGTPKAVQVLEKYARTARGDGRKACTEALRLCSRRDDGRVSTQG
jgi:hypothetical protein